MEYKSIFIMCFSLFRTSPFLPSEKWRCTKQKTTCYAGGTTIAYSKIIFQEYNRGIQATIKEGKCGFMAKANASAHTKWMCKYHIVLLLSYRRKIIYNHYRVDIRDIIKELCGYKGLEIIEGHLMPDFDNDLI